MKRPKKTVVTEEYFKAVRAKYSCPHCKTEFIDYSLSRNVMRTLCSHCDNPIDLEWWDE
jgi:DNA-directed RNA polymerase subunit RPC12/RpoP